MTSIASKNLYDLLGNDPELDPDREPEPPTQAVDKPVARAGKRNAGAEGPVERAPDAGRPRGGGRGGRQENFQGSEQAFRDRGAGAYQNRSKPVDDGLRQDRHPDRLRRPDEHRDIGNRGRGSRGGRGGRGGFEGRGGTRTGRNDRHPNRHNESDHDKQAAHGWGGNTGDAEFADEKAGEALAKEDEKNEDAGPTVPTDGEGFTPDTGAGGDAEVWGAPAENGAAAPAEEKEPEPEDNSKSYEAYLAELAEKKLALGSKLEIRKPNEGSSASFPEGKAFSRDEEEQEYIKGEAQKKARERQKKEKNLLEIDGDAMRPQEPRSEGGRGGRGRGRGGFRGDREGGFRGDREGGFRGRGDREGGPRGDREGGFRGDGRGRGRGRGRGDGEFRGSRGGPRGGPRGGASQGAGLAVDDQTAFPSLGA